MRQTLANRILDVMRAYPSPTYAIPNRTIAQLLDAPEPSVRRETRKLFQDFRLERASDLERDYRYWKRPDNV